MVHFAVESVSINFWELYTLVTFAAESRPAIVAPVFVSVNGCPCIHVFPDERLQGLGISAGCISHRVNVTKVYNSLIFQGY